MKRNFTMSAAYSTGGAMLISGIVSAIPFLFPKLFVLTFLGLIPFAVYFLTENDSGRAFRRKVLLYAFGYHFVGCFWFRSLYPDKLAYVGIEGGIAAAVIVLVLVGLPMLLALIFMLIASLCRYLTKGLPQRFRIYVFPAVFALTEYIETCGTLAFPWCRLSLAVSSFIPVLQTSALFGACFVGYLTALFSAYLAAALIITDRRGIYVRSFAVLAAAVLVFGFARIKLVERGYSDENAFAAAALQGNVAIKIKNAPNVSEIHASYDDLAEKAADAAPDGFPTVIAAPETAAQINLYPDDTLYTHLSSLAEKHDISLAVGAFSYRDGEDGNAVFFFTPDETDHEPYVKRRRVPFGEYLPYRGALTAVLPMLNNIVGMDEEQYAGDSPQIVDTACGKIGTLICFESLFPQTARESVHAGAEILLVCTNDAWFDSSEELHQHTSFAVMRAIENGVPVINAANTGTSALIEPTGKTVILLQAHEQGYIVSLLHKSHRTLYSYIGDVFVYMLIAALIGCFTATLLKKKRHNKVN